MISKALRLIKTVLKSHAHIFEPTSACRCSRYDLESGRFICDTLQPEADNQNLLKRMNLAMNLASNFLKLINLVYKRELDAKRVARVYREYDINRGYAHYHQLCKEKFTRKGTLLSGNPLHKQGVEYLNVLSASDSEKLIAAAEKKHGISYVKKGTKDLSGYRLDDHDFIRNMLSTIITDTVDKRLISFFKSEYLVHWLLFSVSPKAAKRNPVSFRWHCDKGPSQHLKLIIYLNPSAAHGGNTEFVSLDDTASVGAKGYVFGWSKTRSGDIGHLAKIAGRKIESRLQEMNTGDGILFQPANILHRGISPTRGDRYAITLNLLPSPVHWQTALEHNTLSDLAVDGKWHKHARQLLHAIEAGQKS